MNEKPFTQEDKENILHKVTDKMLGGEGMTKKFYKINEGLDPDQEEGEGFTVRPKREADEEKGIKLQDNLESVEMRPGATNADPVPKEESETK